MVDNLGEKLAIFGQRKKSQGSNLHIILFLSYFCQIKFSFSPNGYLFAQASPPAGCEFALA